VNTMPPRVAATFPPDYALDPGVRDLLQLKTFEVLSIYPDVATSVIKLSVITSTGKVRG
jgi:hypothetical protein